MIHILWWLLNAALAAGWLVIGWYALKLLKQTYGIAIAVVFAITTFSFVCQPPTHGGIKTANRNLSFAGGVRSTSLSEQAGLWTVDTSISKSCIYQGQKAIQIYQNLLFSIELYIAYGRDTATNALIPLFAYTSLNGVEGNVKWEPQIPMVWVEEEKDILEYNVPGTMEWKLMNMPIFTQGKQFQGGIKP